MHGSSRPASLSILDARRNFFAGAEINFGQPSIFIDELQGLSEGEAEKLPREV